MDEPTPTDQLTPMHRLADALLGDDGPLESYVAQRRAAGRSWRLVARDLYEKVDVDLTPEILRRWFSDESSSEMAS